jgi:hypothetical protein
MTKKSLLGAQEDRIKTDLRLPPELLDQVEQITTALQIPKNAFFVLAASLLVLQLSPLVRVKQRKALVMAVQDLFQKVLGEIAKTL